MNFQNAAFNGKRGIAGDTVYKEYLGTADKNTTVNLANKMQAAIKNIRGRVYKVEQAMSLYPIAGTSDDYASHCFEWIIGRRPRSACLNSSVGVIYS